MKDYQASLEKLRKDAAEAALISDLATDPTKREMYSKLNEHFSRLAADVITGTVRAINGGTSDHRGKK